MAKLDPRSIIFNVLDPWAEVWSQEALRLGARGPKTPGRKYGLQPPNFRFRTRFRRIHIRVSGKLDREAPFLSTKYG